jgi:tetratricopeptide (TPR) repeat protein
MPPTNEPRSRGPIAAGRQPAGPGLVAGAAKATPDSLESPVESSARVSVHRNWLAAVVLAAVAFAAFFPALRCEFTNFDDTSYVVENVHVLNGLSLPGVRWAFTTFNEANWHPLTWLSLQLDGTFWKTSAGEAEPFGFHLTNVLLHAANTVLLFLALRSLTGAFWRSAVVALLFAVHPLRVESVAWVAERKDVLSAGFGLAALWAYAGYVRGPSVRRYLLVAGLFVLSLLCKPMLVTLPCLLLVLDWWPLERWTGRGAWPLIREKLPLFALSAASSAVTVFAQSGLGAVLGTQLITFGVRARNTLVGYEFYLAKTFWPTRLAVFYPHPGFCNVGIEPPVVAGAAFLLATITVAALLLRRRAPYLLSGWLWYLGTLVPVIGLVQVGSQAYADRYSYFPQIGILIAVCWGAAGLARDWPRVLVTAAAATAVLLAALTWQQTSYWHDSLSLWGRDLEAATKSPLAINNYGAALADQGKEEKAFGYFQAAHKLDPTYPEACFNMGVGLQGQGKLPEAAELFESLCKLEPNATRGPVHLADVYYRQGKLSEAVACYERLLEIAPNRTATYCNLGMTELARNNLDRAADCYRKAAQLQPNLSEAHNGLGSILIRQGKFDEGIAELNEAIRCDPKSGQAYNNLGKALEDRGDIRGAIEHFEKGTEQSPKLAMIWFNLGRMRLRGAKLEDAVDCFEKAVARDTRTPEFRAILSDTLDRLAAARAAAGRFEEAVQAAERSRDVANAAGRPDIARQIEARIERYKHHETVARPGTPP